MFLERKKPINVSSIKIVSSTKSRSAKDDSVSNKIQTNDSENNLQHDDIFKSKSKSKSKQNQIKLKLLGSMKYSRV